MIRCGTTAGVSLVVRWPFPLLPSSLFFKISKGLMARDVVEEPRFRRALPLARSPFFLTILLLTSDEPSERLGAARAHHREFRVKPLSHSYCANVISVSSILGRAPFRTRLPRLLAEPVHFFFRHMHPVQVLQHPVRGPAGFYKCASSARARRKTSSTPKVAVFSFVLASARGLGPAPNSSSSFRRKTVFSVFRLL